MSPAPSVIYTLSLHDALPILVAAVGHRVDLDHPVMGRAGTRARQELALLGGHRRQNGLHVGQDRKSTRLNSSHVEISYAVFCLKKKKTSSCRRYAARARRAG